MLCVFENGERTRDTSKRIFQLMQLVILYEFLIVILEHLLDMLISSHTRPYPTTAPPTQSICRTIAYDSESTWSPYNLINY